jgi:hypothetical protein
MRVNHIWNTFYMRQRALRLTSSRLTSSEWFSKWGKRFEGSQNLEADQGGRGAQRLLLAIRRLDNSAKLQYCAAVTQPVGKRGE